MPDASLKPYAAIGPPLCAAALVPTNSVHPTITHVHRILRELEQSTTIVVERFARCTANGFHESMRTHAGGRQGNAMEIGVRDEWLERVMNACQTFREDLAPRRTRSVRSLLASFERDLPDPKPRAEHAVLRAMLVETSLRWGHADHWAYHAEFPDAECADDPAALALTIWHRPPADAKAAFRTWADTYLETMERVHPRYRASELRRDLDADFAQPLSITRLARSRGVSVRCLQRDFEELTGRTIQDYVRERRLDAAIGMLTTTSDKVEWIANASGWSSRKNLNRALMRCRGTTPSALRTRGRVEPTRC
jgi:AraC-like DNA-binding protein